MQLRTFTDVALETRGLNHRVGTFRFKDMGQGQPGTPGNFYLRLVRSEGDFFSPRHRHNFDQVRLQLEGTFAFAEDGVLKPGWVGYFPEGTAYGPQTSSDDTLQLVLQIGGPSGCGYVSESQRVAGVDALSQIGTFRDGRFFPNGSSSELGADAFEAVWEHVLGEKIRYPAARFERPVLAHPESFGWVACPGAAGVDRKVMWDLGCRTVGCSFYRFTRAAALELPGPLSVFCLSGGGRCAGAGEQVPYGHWDALHLAQGENSTVHGAEGTVLIVFTHPLWEANSRGAHTIPRFEGGVA